MWFNRFKYENCLMGLGAVLFFLSCHVYAENTLFNSGKSEYVIVVAKKPKPIISKVRVGKSGYPGYIFPDRKQKTLMYAAREFQRVVKKVSGVNLPILHDNEKLPVNAKVVLIGTSQLAAKRGLTPEGLNPEGYILKTGNDYVAIIGEVSPDGVDRGTLFGIYDFLERAVGARWYFPGELGTVIPKKSKVNIPQMDLKIEPAFSLRVDGGLGYADVTKRGDTPTGVTGSIWLDWLPALRHGGTSELFVVHTANSWGKYFGKSHPEYFAVKTNGTKEISSGYSTRANHICYSQPGVLRQEIQNLKDWLASKKNFWECGAVRPTKIYSYFNPNDCMKMFGICHCAECMKKWRPEDAFGEHSNLIFGYAAKLAKEIKKLWPNRRLAVLAYEGYEAAPDQVDIPSNLDVMVAQIRGPVMQVDSNIREAETKALERWFNLLDRDKKRLGVWHYFCYPNMFTSNVPMLAARTLARWHRENKNRVSALFNNGLSTYNSPGCQLNFFMIWLWHRIMWDPEADVDELTDDFCRNLFGPAYKPMLEFFKLEIDRWENTVWSQTPNPKQSYIPEKIIHLEIYPPKVTARLKSLLKKAKKLAGKDNIYRKRVDWYANLHQPFFEENRLLNHWNNRLAEVKITKVNDSRGNWWEKCKPYHLTEQTYGKKSKSATDIYFAHNEKEILIHAVMHDSNTAKLVTKGKHNQASEIKKDESLKICFDLDDKAYYHFITVNAAGFLFAGIESVPLLMRGKHISGLAVDWKLDQMPTTKVDVQKDKWILDIKIPLKDFSDWGLEKDLYNRGLRIQIVRSKKTDPKEKTGLCPMLTQSYEFPTTRFGVAEFVK